MALTRDKYRKLPELYTEGKVVVFKDDTVLWLQVLNPLERDEAQHDAQVARSRLVKALKGDMGSEDRLMIEAAFLNDGPATAIDNLIQAKQAEILLGAMEEIEDDPEWTERNEILKRSDSTEVMTEQETELLTQINEEYLAEVHARQETEEGFLRRKYEGMPVDDLLTEYVDTYIERRGSDLATDAFVVTECWYAARCCEGQQGEDGMWDHGKCNGHVLQVYETKDEVRKLPDEIQTLLRTALRELNMSVREAKNSDRQGSSSDSSPLPSEEGESTPSTSTETLVAVPGT